MGVSDFFPYEFLSDIYLLYLLSLIGISRTKRLRGLRPVKMHTNTQFKNLSVGKQRFSFYLLTVDIIVES